MPDRLLGLPDRRWLRPALALDFQPYSYVHESWYEALPHAEQIRQLANVPASLPHVNRYLRQMLKLDQDPPDCDFSRLQARLALLDGTALTQLCLYTGLALRSEALRRELLGERLRRLRETLGDNAFTFAFKRAPFLGAIPNFPFEPADDDPAIRFPVIGARYCILKVADVSAGLARRMALKLPKTWASWISPQDYAPQSAAHEMPSWLQKILKEQFPQWAPLFA